MNEIVFFILKFKIQIHLNTKKYIKKLKVSRFFFNLRVLVSEIVWQRINTEKTHPCIRETLHDAA